MTDRTGESLADHHADEGESFRRGSPSQTDLGMRAVSYLLSGIVVYGGIGWLVDRVWNQSWGLPVGLIVGMGFGVYLVIKRLGGKW